ncbi:hypothetical protein FOZ61_004602, partial [Perkinsus olseni]
EFPLMDSFKSLETLPSDLERYHDWSKAQGQKDEAAISSVKVYFPSDLREEMAVEEESAIEWDQFAISAKKAACRILDGGDVLNKLRSIRLKDPNQVRAVWNRLVNLTTLLYPEAKKSSVKARASESLLLTIEAPRTRRKIMKRIYKDGKIPVPDLLSMIKDGLEDEVDSSKSTKRRGQAAEEANLFHVTVEAEEEEAPLGIYDASDKNQASGQSGSKRARFSSVVEGKWQVGDQQQ